MGDGTTSGAVALGSTAGSVAVAFEAQAEVNKMASRLKVRKRRGFIIISLRKFIT
jgi:hypothetical protein